MGLGVIIMVFGGEVVVTGLNVDALWKTDNVTPEVVAIDLVTE